MLRAILAAATAAFCLIPAGVAAARPAWVDEGVAFITTVSPGANCAPDAMAAPPFPCQIGDNAVNEGYVVYNGVAVKGYCAGADSTQYVCDFRVSHDANPPGNGGPFHHCMRGTSGGKERAWFWDRYQPPRPAATGELATLAECIAKVDAEADTNTSKGGLSFQKQGKGLILNGSAPSNAGNIPKRLAVTLPKGVSFNPKRPCSRSVARGVTLDTGQRCTVVMSGRLNDPNTVAWYALAGPKQPGGRRKLWLRARRGDELVGFGTGTIQPASGGYGQKLVANVGQLGLNASMIELLAEHLRSTKRCRNGRRYRLELTTDAGTMKTSSKRTAAGASPMVAASAIRWSFVQGGPTSPAVPAGPRRPARPAGRPPDRPRPSRRRGGPPSHERARARRAPGGT